MTATIEHWLAERTGLNVEVLGPHALDRAVAARMVACATQEVAAYARLLQDSPRELDNLVDALTILETWFFRDRCPFEFVQEYAKNHSGMRVLSAGCSTGEEPYSIVIALLEAGLPAGSFEVDACDNSQRALRVASRAVYGPRSFRQDWDDFRQKWFEPAAASFVLRPEIRHLVQFHQEDLLHPVFLTSPALYDVVFCRNLLIYFRAEAQNSLLDLIARLLRQDGIVVTGHAEVGILLRHGYRPVGHPHSFACSKRAPAAITEPMPKVTRRAVSQSVRAAPIAVAEERPPASERDQLLYTARQLADQGAFEDASSLCKRLLTQGADADTYYLEGIIHAARDRLDQAEESFRRALYLDPAHYESLIQMSLLCKRQGESARAALFRDRAARLADHHLEAIDAQRS